MYCVAITGASGSIIGIRFIQELLKRGNDITALVSESAWKTINFEVFHNKTNYRSIKDVLEALKFHYNIEKLHEYKDDDFFSPIASGTSSFKAVIIVPTSMKTLSAIAHGYSDSLITRAADVALKEGRTCILVPRETPVSLIHLENMVNVKKAGADIVLPVPGFYNFPETVDDVVNFIIGKIMNLLDIEHNFFPEWGKHDTD